jgi:hypothetical protein
MAAVIVPINQGDFAAYETFIIGGGAP